MHDLEESDTYKGVLKGISLPVTALIGCLGLNVFRAAVLHRMLFGFLYFFLFQSLERTVQHVSLHKNDTSVFFLFSP